MASLKVEYNDTKSWNRHYQTRKKPRPGIVKLSAKQCLETISGRNSDQTTDDVWTGSGGDCTLGCGRMQYFCISIL